MHIELLKMSIENNIYTFTELFKSVIYMKRKKNKLNAAHTTIIPDNYTQPYADNIE